MLIKNIGKNKRQLRIENLFLNVLIFNGSVKGFSKFKIPYRKWSKK